MGFDRRIFESLLVQVLKPARYLGSEIGSVHKDPHGVALRFALAFPEVYEIAQSHPGLQILYDLLNRRSDVYAERAYAPWTDFEALLRAHQQPLVSLETHTPLSEFHVVGFSLQYELTYTNLLMMLDLGGIPLRAEERSRRDPLVVAGGPCAFNPEPLADFLDAVLLGDGEEAIGDLCDVYVSWDRRDRRELLRALSRIPGVYVPSFYHASYSATGRLLGVHPTAPDQPAVVEKRVLRDLDSVPLQETYVVPTVKIVHGRPSLEVMRGCVKGCRFCQAGYIYRPLRERDPRRVLDQAEQAVRATGTDELSLLSLSTGDYSCVNPVLTELMNRYASQRVAVGLPSTRVDALAPSLLEQIRRVRKTGFTLAPEAGTQRLRDIIQKEYQEEELIQAARQLFSLGWRSLKLYFMIGLPGETPADLVGIAELSAKVAAAGAGRPEVTASVSTFVPKPHTPFQWAAQIDIAETESRQAIVRRNLQQRRIRFKWHDARASYLEGVFSRGDRRLGALLLAAYRLGCRFDGWTDVCRVDLWERAFAETGINPADYLRRRHLDEALPWDHISSGVTKSFLQAELARAVEGRLTPDCSIERCTYCGACDFTTVRNVTYHVSGAKGGVHRGEIIDNWAQVTVDAGAESGSWEPRGWQKIHGRLRPVEADATASDSSPDSAPISGRDARPSSAVSHALAETSVPQHGLGNADEWLTAASDALAPALPAANDAPAARFRLIYRKHGRARFISQVELVEVFTRAFHRARIPLSYSRGHHPLPRFRFGPGLPVGVESDCEVLDVDLPVRLPPAAVAAALQQHLPGGMSVADASEISLRAPSPDSEMTAVRYRITLDTLINGDDGNWIDDRFNAFRERSTFVIRKRTPTKEKDVDARALVQRLERIAPELAELDLQFSRDGSVRPSELLAAVLELDAQTARALPLRKTHAFYRSDADPRSDAAAV